jgi:hypothetical protein
MFFVGAAALCFLLFAAACSHYRAATTLRSNNLRAYDGPARDKGEVGFLGCSAGDLEIAEVDGRPVAKIRAEAGFEGEYSYLELAPGLHRIRIVGTTFDTTQKRFHTNLTIDIASFTHATTGESSLDLKVKAGRVYLIETKIEKLDRAEESGKADHILRILIRDVQSKEIVAEDRHEIIK